MYLQFEGQTRPPNATQLATSAKVWLPFERAKQMRPDMATREKEKHSTKLSNWWYKRSVSKKDLQKSGCLAKSASCVYSSTVEQNNSQIGQRSQKVGCLDVPVVPCLGYDAKERKCQWVGSCCLAKYKWRGDPTATIRPDMRKELQIFQSY